MPTKRTKRTRAPKEPLLEGMVELLETGEHANLPRIVEVAFDSAFWAHEVPAAWKEMRNEILAKWPKWSRPWAWWWLDSGLNVGNWKGTMLEIPMNQKKWLAENGYEDG